MALTINDSDVVFEEEILRNPYSVRVWLRYLEHKRGSPQRQRNVVYERALQELPGSFKLWYHYLRERRAAVRARPPTDDAYEEVNAVFERALVFMHKMPRIWLDYCRFVVRQGFVTRARLTFDRALRSLPVTQHQRIWPLYLDFVRSYNLPETAVRVYRRYLKLNPHNVEEYIDYLISVQRYDEAARRLAFDVVNRDTFVSKAGKTQHQLWVELCDLISRHPDKVTSLKVEAIIRGGLRRFTDMLGKLWCALADYFIRLGNFERARDIYEEAIGTVMTVRDFSQVFDAYAQFEEATIASQLADDNGDDNDNDDDEENELTEEMHLARFEYLMERRPLLLSSVLLRQNPHNVPEWLKRVTLYEGHTADQIRTFTEALQTVDPLTATGNAAQLWIEFALFYERHGQLDDARTVFKRATKATVRKTEDLADIWLAFAEMEVRAEQPEEALKLMRRATTPLAHHGDDDETVANAPQRNVNKSLRLWAFYVDLEESLGTFESTKAVYNRILALRIATPQIIINYAMFLEENHYFEEAFSVYERGISIFRWPVVFDIYNTYLSKFLARYGGRKLERARDLFEQVLSGCPKERARTFYLMYAKLEEEHGLARHAMSVYERATKTLPTTERYDMYLIYIHRAAELFGVTHTRTIYEQAIEALPDKQAKLMSLQFAELERKLGEIDRARAIFAHGSQLADPRGDAAYWKAWNDFEVRHGNEDTFREMLRIKRSVSAIFNTTVNISTAQVKAIAGENTMEQLEAQQNQAKEEQAAIAAVAASSGPTFVRSTTQGSGDVQGAANPEEIALDDDDDDDAMDEGADAAPKVNIQQKQVPSSVFGGIAVPAAGEEPAPTGAKALFAQRKK